MALLCLILTNCCLAQEYYIPKTDDSTALAKRMPLLASNVLLNYKTDNDEKTYLNNLFRLQILAGKYSGALKTIASLRNISDADDPGFTNLLCVQHELYAKAKLQQSSSDTGFNKTFTGIFQNLFQGIGDMQAFHISTAFITRNGVAELKNNFMQALANAQQRDSVSISDAIALCRNYYIMVLYQHIQVLAHPLLSADENRRYTIENALIKTQDGATIHAIVVRKKGVTTPQPVVLQYTIYADSSSRRSIIEPAAYGYTGVMAYSRGKGLSTDVIVPFEHDGRDANAVIDWISKQSWCNGKIGMYGGSYNGFTQWAAAKYRHPALKTIVPYVAAIPGQGLPMENNVFITPNYGWNFYVTGNHYLDNKVYNNPQRWQALDSNWYASGAAYRKIDSIDGTPNPLLQKYLKHPAFDKFWQDQVPYKKDFAGINIPVLTFSGYYDDGQISALTYLIEHNKYNPKANHYLIIGPYDHFGAQRGGEAVLRDYAVDPVALISTRNIAFQWLDYILKGGKKPEILKDKINYEVMGANVWKHAPTLQKMADKTLKLYLTAVKKGEYYNLSQKKQATTVTLNQQVDFADRKTSNNDYYPFPIIKKELDHSNGLFFITQPFDKPFSVNGMFSGELKALINKKDMDIGVVLYEVTPKGEYFELSYFLGRASYAGDMSKRVLLHPGKVETIPFSRSRLVSRQLSKGSRLLVVLNINKNSSGQINYGTGKDVSDETIKDAKTPLKIKWYSDSFVNIPVAY